MVMKDTRSYLCTVFVYLSVSHRLGLTSPKPSRSDASIPSSWLGHPSLQHNFKSTIAELVCESIATQLKLAILTGAVTSGSGDGSTSGSNADELGYAGMLAGIFSGGAAVGAAALYTVYRKRENVS
jgi:hypothetical protein